MIKYYTCIICPNGCEIAVDVEDDKISAISGNTCTRGVDYVKNEINNPMRNISTSVFIKNGDVELCSVRLTKPIPKTHIFDVLSEIKKLRLKAPINIGDVLISNVLGLDCDVISTRKINSK